MATFTFNVKPLDLRANTDIFTTSNTTTSQFIFPLANDILGVQPTNQYIWFVSTNPNAIITNNGFNTIVGPWNSTTAFFIKQTVNLTLADNTTIGSLTFYRTRELITLSSVQNFTIT